MNEKVQIQNSLVHCFLLLTRIQNNEINYEDVIHKSGTSKKIEEQDLFYVASEYYGFKVKK